MFQPLIWPLDLEDPNSTTTLSLFLRRPASWAFGFRLWICDSPDIEKVRPWSSFAAKISHSSLRFLHLYSKLKLPMSVAWPGLAEFHPNHPRDWKVYIDHDIDP